MEFQKVLRETLDSIELMKKGEISIDEYTERCSDAAVEVYRLMDEMLTRLRHLDTRLDGIEEALRHKE